MKQIIILFIITSALLITATGCNNTCKDYPYKRIYSFDKNHNGCIEDDEYYEFTKDRVMLYLNIKYQMGQEWSKAFIKKDGKAMKAWSDAQEECEELIKTCIVAYIRAKRNLSWWSVFTNHIPDELEIAKVRSKDFSGFDDFNNYHESIYGSLTLEQLIRIDDEDLHIK